MVSLISSATSATPTTSTATSFTANVPGMAAGDVAVMQVLTSGSGSQPSTPSGWTLLTRTTTAYYALVSVYTKTAAASVGAGTASFTSPSQESWAVVCSVWRNATVGVYATAYNGSAAQSGTTVTAPSITPTTSGVWLALIADTSTSAYYPPPLGATPSGWTLATTASAENVVNALFYKPDTGGTPTGTQQFTTVNSTDARFAVSLALYNANRAPNAPALTSPASNATIDRAVAQRFAWTFSDPDVGDSQSAYEIRYQRTN